MSIVNSEFSTVSKGSVYQTDGKPLSKEALYKAKLKYGIYHNPSTKSTGFENATSASDSAALLASTADLKVEPYKRTLATDAQTAALFAKSEPPKRWTKDTVDFDATSAAQSAKTAASNELHYKVDADSSSAASAALKQKNATSKLTPGAAPPNGSHSAAHAALGQDARSLTSTSSNLASLYEFDAVRNGTKKPEHMLNLSKITAMSEQRASTLISQRTNPEWDASRSGLQTKKIDDKLLEAFAASAALSSQGYKAPEDPNLEARAIYKNSLVDPKLLNLASLKAAATLKGVDKYLGEKYPTYKSVDYNKIAIEIAKRQQERRAADPRQGKIDVGGGLFMSQAELDQIASRFVNPLLEDINLKAEAQRKKDAEIAAAQEEHKRAHEEFKAQEKAKKLEEKRQKEEAKAQRRKELEEEKAKQLQAKKELQELKGKELKEHEDILKTKQEEEERRTRELLSKKQAHEEKLTSEFNEAEAQRQAELEGLKTEREQKLAPILKELDEETDKLNLLESEKKAVEEITASQVLNIENSKKLIESSKTELTSLDEQLVVLKEEITKATTEKEKLAKEHEVTAKETEIAVKKAKELQLENDLKKLELDQEKSTVEIEKLQLLLELENEKIDALHDEKQIIETLPPSEEERLKEAESSKKQIVTGEGVKTLEEPRLEKTFTGFSQGSNDERVINDSKESSSDAATTGKKKKKSFFKEFF